MTWPVLSGLNASAGPSPLYWPEVLQSIRSIRAQKFDLVIDLCKASCAAVRSAGWPMANISSGWMMTAKAHTFSIIAPCRAPAFTRTRWIGISPCCRRWAFPSTGISPGCRRVRPEASATVKSKWNVAGEQNGSLCGFGRALGQQALAGGRSFPPSQCPCSPPDFRKSRFVILGGKDEWRSVKRFPAHCHRGASICAAQPRYLKWWSGCGLPVCWSRMIPDPCTWPPPLTYHWWQYSDPTEPRRTGPYGQLQNVLRIELPCSPCLKADCHYEKREECLRALPPEAVFFRRSKKCTVVGTHGNNVLEYTLNKRVGFSR